jgi:TetR/AcrR family transcriptional regulator, mexJK operon transcriptional repressor
MITQSPRQQAKREQIRTAARDLFLRHGFAETSMDAVTAAAGVSKQTLYRYCETKAQLFGDVLRELITQAGPAPVAGPPQPRVPRSQAELEASLVVLSERYLARLMKPEQLALLRVVIAEGSRFPELTESFRSTVPAAEAAATMAVIEGGLAGGQVAEWVEVRAAARALAGLLLAFVFRDGLLAAEPRLPARHELAEMVHIFVRGIGTRPRAPVDGEVSQ